MATNSIITKVTGTDASSNRIGSTFYGTCATAAGTAEKAVTLSDSCVFNDNCLVTGVTIHVKFTNSNTHATPTLKIGSATPKQIMAYGTTKVGTTPETSWYEGAVVSFTYDGTYWVMNDHSAIDAIISAIYPVGSIYMSVNNINPGTYLTGTTWEAWGAGRVPVGVDAKQKEFNTVEKTGGEKTHTLTVEEMPAHDHIPYESEAYFVNYNTTYKQVQIQGGSNNNCDLKRHSGSTGGNSAHNNMQPYITCYMWKRVS